MQSVLITTNIVSSNTAHGEVYLIHHYVIKFVSDSRQISGYLRNLPFSSINKTDRHDIIEILLNVAFKHHSPLLSAGVWFFSVLFFAAYNRAF